MVVILSDPERIVAAGGIVRAVNGSLVRNGTLIEARLPSRPLEIIQVVEYLRAFLLGREAWARWNMLPNISGAFGVFRRDLLIRAGGYRPAAIGEDFDLVTRLHRHLLEQKQTIELNSCLTRYAGPKCFGFALSRQAARALAERPSRRASPEQRHAFSLALRPHRRDFIAVPVAF